MSDRSEFRPNGTKVFYWPNGNKRLEGTFEKGEKVGEFKFYNEDGSLNSTISYKNDVPNGNAIRYYNTKPVMKYNYSDGTLQGSLEYISDVLIGEYSYSDALIYPDPDAPEPPPIGTLYHSYNGKHPGEIFKGTLWSYVENSYEVDNNGNSVPVDVWLREPNGGRGPFVYNGAFKEYRASNGKLLRTGSYYRKIKPGSASESYLHGPEVLYRENGSTIYKGKWDIGVKIEKVEFLDSKDRVWKAVNLTADSKYKDGSYNILDIWLKGAINYTFDPVTQVASLKMVK